MTPPRIPARRACRPFKWPTPVRERVLKMAEDPDLTITAIARAVGVPFSTAQGWIADAIAAQNSSAPAPGSTSEEGA